MPTVRLGKTEFTFSVLPSKSKQWAKVKIAVNNEYLSYVDEGEYVSLEELDSFSSALPRLLAGGYGREYTLSFEKAGLAVDLYTTTDGRILVSREERRNADCVMAVRLLMRSKDKKSFLDGVYTLLLRKAEIARFASELREEIAKNIKHRIHNKGKYVFVGVSPLGYNGCNYLYFNPKEKVEEGEYVWVKMGRHNTEQIVHVDSVRRFNDDDLPYDPQTVKRVLRKATTEEIAEIRK